MYVDDILLSRDDIEGINKTKNYFRGHFIPKDLGHPKYYL